MKTLIISTIAALCVICSCKSSEKTSASDIRFGIYETVKRVEIPDQLNEKLKTAGIVFENDTTLPFIGYLQKTDTLSFPVSSLNGNIKILVTAYPVDSAGRYTSLVAVKAGPVIQNKDIQKTKATGKDVEIHFTMEGAKKWASMTKNNIGNHVAFVIDDRVYDLPMVNAEIKGGIARIGGPGDEMSAQKLSESLNSGIR